MVRGGMGHVREGVGRAPGWDSGHCRELARPDRPGPGHPCWTLWPHSLPPVAIRVKITVRSTAKGLFS